MKNSRLFRNMLAVLLVILILAGTLPGCSRQDRRIPVQVLILSKFEVDEMAGDFPGEAQSFYEAYLSGGDEYEIAGCPDTVRLYYKNGVAMCTVGQGKVAAALNTAAVLSDERFDFSEAYVLSVGCCGSAAGYGIFGDVYVISAAVDYDLGHHADPREMKNEGAATWFHDESFDSTAVVRLNDAVTDRVFELVKDLPLDTTERTVRFLEKEYPGETWANRQPRVLPGISVTADNFWKGRYDHQNALLAAETYGCGAPYASTEMEDVAVAQAVKQAGLLERLIILRVSVNMDVFPSSVTPEMLWGADAEDHLASEDSLESVDIFETAMRNCFSVGKTVIDALLDGTF